MKFDSKRLIVVDDEPLDQMLVERTFAQEAPEVEVCVCDSATKALDRVADGNIGIVLLDINMPGLDGFQILERLRELRFGSFPPVVMLSTSENPEDIRRAYAEGASAYIVKPADIGGYAELARSIRDFWFDIAICP